MNTCFCRSVALAQYKTLERTISCIILFSRKRRASVLSLRIDPRRMTDRAVSMILKLSMGYLATNSSWEPYQFHHPNCMLPSLSSMSCSSTCAAVSHVVADIFVLFRTHTHNTIYRH